MPAHVGREQIRPSFIAGSAAYLFQFYVTRFLFGYCSHTPLPLVLILITTLVLGMGEGFGITDLIYHADELQQVLGGAALALVIVASTYAGFILDTRHHPLVCSRAELYHKPYLGLWWYTFGIVLSFFATLGLAYGVYLLMLLILVARRSVAGLTAEEWDPLAFLWNDSRQHLHLSRGMVYGFAYSLITGWICYGLAGSLRKSRSTPAGRAGEPAGGTTAKEQPTGEKTRSWMPNPDWVWLGGPRTYPRTYLSFWVLIAFLGVYYPACSFVYLITRTELVPGEWLGAWLELALTSVILAILCYLRRHKLAPLLHPGDAPGSPQPQSGLDQYDYLWGGLLFTGTTLLLFYVLNHVLTQSTVGCELSPVVLVGMALFTLLVLYTVVAFTFSRAVPVVVIGALALVVIGGIPPYKFRFPGLEGRYNAGTGESPPPGPEERNSAGNGGQGILDLDKQLAREIAWYRQDSGDLKKQKDAGRYPRTHPADYAAVEKRMAETHYRLLEPPDLPEAPPEYRAGFGAVVSPFNPDSLGETRVWRKKSLDVLVPYNEISWLPQRTPLLIVSVSGGGHAAACWTLGVLNKLEAKFAEHGVDFPSHVLLITGASGGMLGAGYYVVSLPPAGARTGGKFVPKAKQADGRLKDQVEALLAEDFLTPLVNRMLFNDAPAYLSPFPNFRDRGRVLEKAWEDTILGEKHLGAELKGQKSPFSMTFQELQSREKTRRYPYLVFTPMMIEDGRRLLISNLDLRSVVNNSGSGLEDGTVIKKERDYIYSREGMEFFRLFPEQHESFRLSTAIRMSATFPFFSPAVSLPTMPRRRVVDAGYYDNYGVSVAASWLFSTDHQAWMDQHIRGVALIQIRASQSEGSRRLQSIDKSSDSLLSRAMDEAVSPLEGLNQARVGSSSFRNDGQLELLSKYFREKKEDSAPVDQIERYFTTVTFELNQDVSLSWYLGKSDRQKIRKGLGLGQSPTDPKTDVEEKAEYLIQWFQYQQKVIAEQAEKPAERPRARKR